MNIDEILKIRPQIASLEYGPELSLRQLLEEYYKTHLFYPESNENIKDIVNVYIDKLKEEIVNEEKRREEKDRKIN